MEGQVKEGFKSTKELEINNNIYKEYCQKELDFLIKIREELKTNRFFNDIELKEGKEKEYFEIFTNKPITRKVAEECIKWYLKDELKTNYIRFNWAKPKLIIKAV